MATQTQNKWELFLVGLRELGQQPEREGILKEEETLQDLALRGSSEDFLKHARTLLETHKDEIANTLGHPGEFIQNNEWEDVLKQAENWRDKNFPLGQENKAPEPLKQPEKPSNPFAGLFKNDSGGGGGGGPTKEEITPSSMLRSIQEQRLLSEFDGLLKDGNQEKIAEFLDKRLEAPDLLKEQWEIANHHIEQWGVPQNQEEDKRKLLYNLMQQRDQQAEKLRNDLQAPKSNTNLKYRQDLTASIKKAHAAGDQEGAKIAFRALAQQQIGLTKNYSVLREYESKPGYRAFLARLSEFFQESFAMEQEILLQQAQMAQNAIHKNQAINANAHAQAQMQQAQQNARPPANNRKSQAGDAIKNIKSKLFNDLKKKASQALAKAAAATIEIWGPPVAIGCLILGLFLIFVAIVVIIIIVISLFSHNTPSPILTCDHPLPSNVTNVADIQTAIQQNFQSGFHLDGDIFSVTDAQIQQAAKQLGKDPDSYLQQVTSDQLLIAETTYNTFCYLDHLKTTSSLLDTQASSFYLHVYNLVKNPDCSVKYQNNATNYAFNGGNRADVTFYGLTTAVCSPQQVQFTIAQQLSLILANRYLSKQSDVGKQNRNDFINRTNSLTPRLSTPTCLSVVFDQIYPGGDDGLMQCFADTVATYLVNNGFTNSSPPSSFIGGSHGAFAVATAAEVDQAAQLGITYIMPYAFQNATAFLTPGTNEYNAMIRNKMKLILDVHWDMDAGCNVNTNKLKADVTKYNNSALLIGYWTKDDDYGCGMKKGLQEMYGIIHSIDHNPQHVVIAGFGVDSSVQNNYTDGEADVLGFYPYPAYNGNETVDQETKNMVRIVKSRTPAGKNPPPFIGTYQAFYGNHYVFANGQLQQLTYPPTPFRSSADVDADVQAFLTNGAVSIMGFGWEELDVQYFVGVNPLLGQKDPRLAQVVQGVTTYLNAHH